jgi:acyl-CoA synthetase (AMP-forming)/AMP-acid ligase II
MADAPPLSFVCHAVGSATGVVLINGQLGDRSQRLAGFKVPRDVVFVDELRRLPTGKIRERELWARHGTGSGRVTADAAR